MKKFFFTTVLAIAAVALHAQPPAGDAKPGDYYGEKVTTDGAVSLKDAASKLDASHTEVENAKIKAKVVDVCSKKGCWITLEMPNGETAMVKMKDYGFFVPLAAKGKTVVIDGNVSLKTTSVAELKHYAEDAKKSKEEIDAITKPQQEVRVLAKGIVVVE